MLLLWQIALRLCHVVVNGMQPLMDIRTDSRALCTHTNTHSTLFIFTLILSITPSPSFTPLPRVFWSLHIMSTSVFEDHFSTHPITKFTGDATNKKHNKKLKYCMFLVKSLLTHKTFQLFLSYFFHFKNTS